MSYYTDIEDFPLYNWRKIQEKSLIQYTRKDIEKGNVKNDRAHWELIQDSFINEFGLSKDYKRILELQRDIALLECDLVIEDNAFLQNKIRQLTRELEELRTRGIDSDMDESIHYIESWRKIEINEHTTTVRKFYKLLRTYKKENEQRKKAE